MVEDATDQDRRVKGTGPLAGVLEGGTCGIIGLVVKEGRGGDSWREGGLQRELKTAFGGWVGDIWYEWGGPTS